MIIYLGWDKDKINLSNYGESTQKFTAISITGELVIAADSFCRKVVSFKPVFDGYRISVPIEHVMNYPAATKDITSIAVCISGSIVFSDGISVFLKQNNVVTKLLEEPAFNIIPYRTGVAMTLPTLHKVCTWDLEDSLKDLIGMH